MSDAIPLYLEYLNEDFSFVQKVFKGKVLSKIGKEVKDSVKGKSLNSSKLEKALKPIPVLGQDKINRFLKKYIPNYDRNFKISLSHFSKKYPDRAETNEKVSAIAALNASANSKKSIKDSIRDLDRSYSRGSGGASFILFLIGLFAISGVWSLEILPGEAKVAATILGSLLMIASFKT